MKYYSNFRMFIEYIIIMLFLYFLSNALIAFIGRINYRDTLSNPDINVTLLLLWYWWPPIFRMFDMDKKNDTYKEFMEGRKKEIEKVMDTGSGYIILP